MSKVLVSIEDGLLRRIDRAARAASVSRSAYLSDLAANGMNRRSGPGTTPTVRSALKKLDRLVGDESGGGDSTDALRAHREAR